MPPSRKLGHDTLVLVRAPLTTDTRDNSEYRDWDNATRTDIVDCMVQPFPMAEKIAYERTIDREFARTAFRVWCPAGTDVTSSDKIEYEGKTYEVFGGSGTWKDHRGVPHHSQFIMRLKEG